MVGKIVGDGVNRLKKNPFPLFLRSDPCFSMLATSKTDSFNMSSQIVTSLVGFSSRVAHTFATASRLNQIVSKYTHFFQNDKKFHL
jgi:hypothetical protein